MGGGEVVISRFSLITGPEDQTLLLRCSRWWREDHKTDKRASPDRAARRFNREVRSSISKKTSRARLSPLIKRNFGVLSPMRASTRTCFYWIIKNQGAKPQWDQKTGLAWGRPREYLTLGLGWGEVWPWDRVNRLKLWGSVGVRAVGRALSDQGWAGQGSPVLFCVPWLLLGPLLKKSFWETNNVPLHPPAQPTTTHGRWLGRAH